MLSIVELVKLNILSSVVTLFRYMGGGGGSLSDQTKNVCYNALQN